MKKLLAISLWQPWATYMADLLKANETRHWSTPIRGLIAIHAAKTTQGIAATASHLHAAGREDLLGRYIGVPWPHGCIVAVGELYDVQPAAAVVDKISVQERAMGNYEVTPFDREHGSTRYAWLFRNVRKVDPPILCKGQQGFWTLPEDVTAAVWKVLGVTA